MEQWITSFEAYDNAISILKAQDPPDDRLRGEIQLNYSEAKKRAKLASVLVCGLVSRRLMFTMQRRSDGSKLLVSGLAGQQPWELAVAIADEFKLKPAWDISITSAVRSTPLIF